MMSEEEKTEVNPDEQEKTEENKSGKNEVFFKRFVIVLVILVMIYMIYHICRLLICKL